MRCLVIALLSSLLLFGPAAEAAVSAQQAAAIARSASGGKVLKVTPQGHAFKVKVLTKKGVVKTLYIDANTGKIRR